MDRSFWFLVLVVCIVCSGCKTVSTSAIHVDIDVPYHNIRTLAVMRFDDEYIQKEGVKGFLVKTITNPDAGEMLANMMTHELLTSGKYRILTRSKIKNKIKAKDAKEEELVKQRDYIALGKILKADAVVIGKIYKFGISNMTIYERGNVSFKADCIDTKNGKVLWSIEMNKSAPYKDEVELANKAVGEAIEKLKKEIE